MQSPQTIEIKGIKVLTTKQIAEAYGVKPDIIGYNFRYNKERYVEGKHYIKLEGEELRLFKASREIQDSYKVSNFKKIKASSSGCLLFS
jgi:hypothetical protein